MLIDVDRYAEREENDPKQPMNHNPVFFAASQFGVWISTLELELVLTVEPNPVVKSLPFCESPMHGQNALSRFFIIIDLATISASEVHSVILRCLSLIKKTFDLIFLIFTILHAIFYRSVNCLPGRAKKLIRLDFIDW